MGPSEFTHLLSMMDNLSPEQVQQLRRHLDERLTALDAGPPPSTDGPMANQALQRRLVEAGILGAVKPPITDLEPYRRRRAVPIQGEPLSETVIRERR